MELIYLILAIIIVVFAVKAYKEVNNLIKRIKELYVQLQGLIDDFNEVTGDDLRR